MKRLALHIIAILAFATATAHQPATMRNGYDHYPLRGAVKQMRHYSSTFSEHDGALVPDTANHAYTMSLYEFNRAGDVVQEVFFRTPHRAENKSARKECDLYYVYDERGNCTERRTIYHNDSARYSHIVYYTYDDRGLLTESYDLRTDGRKISYNRYKYNRKGQKVEHQSRYSAPASHKELTPYPQTRYKYNAAGQCSKEITINNLGEVKGITKMTYNDRGNLIRIKRVPRSSAKPQKGYIIMSSGNEFSRRVGIYRYDERGNKIESLSLSHNKSTDIKVEREFDEWDNCTRYRRYYTQNDTTRLVESLATQYEYDEQGNWIKRINLKEIDGKFRPNWITVREIVYYE